MKFISEKLLLNSQEFIKLLESSMKSRISLMMVLYVFVNLLVKNWNAGLWYGLYQLSWFLFKRGNLFRKKFRKAWHPDIKKERSFHKIQSFFYRKPKSLINILTRTSGRPNAFKKCRDSVENQTYPNISHIVSFDVKQDLDYLLKYEVNTVDVSLLKTKNTEEVKSYNLYCNKLLDQVSSGWVLFLDDDNILKEKNTLEILVSQIKFMDEDTLIIFQTEFPDHSKIPQSYYFKRRSIEKYQIDTGCVLFHSKYASLVQWDNKRMADYRFIKRISEIIPKQKWIEMVMTKKLNFGDSGNRNDIQEI